MVATLMNTEGEIPGNTAGTEKDGTGEIGTETGNTGKVPAFYPLT